MAIGEEIDIIQPNERINTLTLAQAIGDAAAVMMACSLICYTLPRVLPPIALGLQGSVSSLSGAYQNALNKAPIL